MSPLILAGLAGVGLFAGFVDAIAGGGGLLTVPALALAGLDPVLAVAWPFTIHDAVLSAKDKAHPTLQDLPDYFTFAA